MTTNTTTTVVVVVTRIFSRVGFQAIQTFRSRTRGRRWISYATRARWLRANLANNIYIVFRPALRRVPTTAWSVSIARRVRNVRPSTHTIAIPCHRYFALSDFWPTITVNDVGKKKKMVWNKGAFTERTPYHRTTSIGRHPETCEMKRNWQWPHPLHLDSNPKTCVVFTARVCVGFFQGSS